MPTHIKATIAWKPDSALPRDAMVCTAHFRHTAVDDVSIDYGTLATDLRNLLSPTWVKAGVETEVKLYNMGDTTPRPVRGRAVINEGLHGETQQPREIALCLSYYAGRNLPRQRGRMYLPVALMSTGATGLGNRPAQTWRDSALSLVTNVNKSFPDLGGVNVQWCVYSPTDGELRTVTNAYVDDEWDTVRARGLRATTRTTAAREG